MEGVYSRIQRHKEKIFSLQHIRHFGRWKTFLICVPTTWNVYSSLVQNPINVFTGSSFDRASASILCHQEVQRDSLALQKPFFFLESYQFWAVESRHTERDLHRPHVTTNPVTLEPRAQSGDLLKTHDVFCVHFIFSSESRLAGSVDNPSSSLFLEKQKELPMSRKNSGSFLGERPTNAVSCGLITSRRWALFMDRLVVCAHPKQPEKEILIKQKAEAHCSILNLKSSYLHLNSWQDILISILMAWNGKNINKQICLFRHTGQILYA